MKWNEWLPVLISIGVIILVALLQKQSRLVAAVTATMPLTAPLALWIVFENSGGERQTVTEFSRGLFIGLIPTLAFALVLWLTARAGFKLGPMLLSGYLTWGLILAVLIVLQRLMGSQL